jgi:hypothetical protein
LYGAAPKQLGLAASQIKITNIPHTLLLLGPSAPQFLSSPAPQQLKHDTLLLHTPSLCWCSPCRYALTYEATPGLWQAQADAAVAVCLQALAGAGLLPACWEGHGYDQVAAEAGDSDTECYQVPPGCRQLVTLLRQETKEKVSEKAQWQV